MLLFTGEYLCAKSPNDVSVDWLSGCSNENKYVVDAVPVSLDESGKMDLAEDVDDSVEEENILYFLTTHTEWSLEPEVAVSLDKQ